MKIGLTLGSGGARGLAHILILEAFDEMGIKPSIISGCSIGAIIGAMYAAGISAKELKEIVDEIVFQKNTKFWEIHKKSDWGKMLDFLDPSILKTGGIIKGEKFINFIGETIKIKTFKELKIPLKVVATDYWEKKQVVLSKGDLLESVRASYSIPGLFAPVKLKKQLLMDGGMVNPLPYDLIKDDVDFTIAIDVTSPKAKFEDEIPPAYELLFSAYQIMQISLINEKLKLSRPNVLLKTNIQNIRVGDFMKAPLIYEQAKPCKERIKRKLDKLFKKR